MHCLVTGASGYIGEALVGALLKRDCRVTAHLGRRPTPAPSDRRLLEMHGELGDIGTRSLQGVDCVFHLAAIAHQGAGAVAYRRVNVDASLALARRALEAGVARFVFFSSVKAALARSPAAEELDYAASKALAEEQLAVLCREASMRLVIVRPALVYGGSEKGNLMLLDRWVRWHLPRPPVGGARSLIARSDVVDLALRLLDSTEEETPSTVVLSDGEAYTTRRLHLALCRALDRHPWFPSPPLFAWRAACGLVDALRRAPRGASWRRLAGEELYSSKGLKQLGFVPRHSFESALGLGNGLHRSAESISDRTRS
ncbi:MAG: NAD-dependent epimerase/dehydratase family protein [Pseudomonadota bacterium]